MAPATPSNSRTSRAASPPTPPMRLPPKATQKRNMPAKKPAFSKSKYAEMALIMGAQGREELHPLPRPHLQRNLEEEEEEEDDDEVSSLLLLLGSSAREIWVRFLHFGMNGTEYSGWPFCRFWMTGGLGAVFDLDRPKY